MPQEYIDQFHPPEYAPHAKFKDLRIVGGEKIAPIKDQKIINSKKDRLFTVETKLSRPGLSPDEKATLQEEKENLTRLLEISGVDVKRTRTLS